MNYTHIETTLHLTRVQYQTWHFIVHYKSLNGHVPTVPEIASGMSLSRSAAFKRLEALRGLGMIRGRVGYGEYDL